MRVTAINISTTFSTFFSEQLNEEQRVESMADSGQITTREADEMNEEWERREWRLRMDALPQKIGWALARFHACTALMRFYEFLVARCVLRVDGPPEIRGGVNTPRAAMGGMTQDRAVEVMDKLTRDPYQASLRTSQLLHHQEHSPGRVVSSKDGTETSTSSEVMRRMYSTCIWANIIPFLAELTVQQLVLAYGYGVYYLAKKKRRERKEEECDNVPGGRDKEDYNSKTQTERDNDYVSESAYALSMMFQSSRLTVARSMSWIAASAGGAVGSAIYPGWGAVFGIQIGDSVVGALID